MLYLYLDESGDLGFDFFAKKPSKHFTVTVMLVRGMENRKKIAKAVRRTLHNKLAKQQTELKGSKQSIDVKRYFYRYVESVPFELYALTLNKRRVYDHLSQKKDRVYNFIARKVLDVIPFTNASMRVSLVIDRSKSKKEIREFNDYLIRHLSGRIEPKIPLDIDHHLSHEDLPLQAVDLFSWGIFRKYEKDDREWFDVFKDQIKYDDVYLP
jgi:DNA-directed RNA polymerase subunit F